MTIDETRALLQSGDFQAFIGQAEDQWFEAKGGAGYDLATAGGRFELAKDVVALANAEGGYVILGLTTTRSPDENVDRVSALALPASTAVSAVQVRGIVESHVHPAIAGLEVTWHESPATAGNGLLAILVPPQQESRKWFLLGRVVVDGEAVKQIVFGIARRVDSANEPWTLEQVYRATQSGKSDVATRLTRIEEKIDGLGPARAAAQAGAIAALDERIQALL